ncbi:hypothetical protein BC828DRAFT_409154 [Blastocladiella britannica]|nr:hypothetical protein BC828DRAFT_409154 [Blastocladiella britannica]
MDPQQQQPPLFPAQSDPALHRAIAVCGAAYAKFARCQRRALALARESNEYRALVATATDAAQRGASDRAVAQLHRRADNELVLTLMRECGYARSPLRDCLAAHACADRLAARDAYVAAAADLSSLSAKTEAPAVRADQMEVMAQMAAFDKGITDCVRTYQFAMTVAFIPSTAVFDVTRLDKVQVDRAPPS